MFAKRFPALALAAACSLASLAAHAQSVSVPSAVQNFDSLASTGTSSTLPSGWFLAETGSNANATYAADDGTLNSGNTYSYGSSGSGERALGGLQSSSLNPAIGAKLVNSSGGALAQIVVTYTGEQWRLGALAREDRLDFQYSLDATSLSTGTWVDVNALDLVAPVTTGTAGVALNGNIAANQVAKTASITGLNLATSGTIWVRWTDLNPSGSDDALAIDNISFTAGGPPVNTPPSITSTVPANSGSVLPGTQAFTVNFSELVTMQDTAFSMSCSVTGAVALGLPAPKSSANGPGRTTRLSPVRLATVNGVPVKASIIGSSVVLTTAAVLQNGETCTFTIDADGIADSEDAHPTADTVVNFSVAPAPNVRPNVVSSTPTNNATGVGAGTDLRIVFNEMVKADSESFVLSCTMTGMIAPLFEYKVLETTAEGGRAITLSPRVLLQEGENCTLTVLAVGVADGSDETMAQDHVIAFKIAGGTPLVYYAQVNASSAEQLRCSLHETINGHTAYPYSASTTDTWDILEIADEDPNNAGRILDVYKNRSFTKVSDRAGTGSGVTYNREHTWPNSLGFSDSGSTPYTDTHMLYLSDTGYNSDRGNSPYANCTQASGCTERTTEVNNGFGGGSGSYPGNSNWYNANSFQTWNHRQGDVARAVMYMAIRYEGGGGEPDLELTDNVNLIVATSSSPAYMGLLSTLLAWHAADPPDAAELERNQVIFSFQANRNPFIDHPEWATQALFTSSKPASCQLAN